MTKIFISYRRDDSADIAGRIYDRLVKPLGPFDRADVFKDDSIPLGVNFKKYLESQVAQCQIELVIMGKQWASIADSTGQRRLHDPSDFVRIEVEAALLRGIPVIPLLVGGASMPGESDLPDSLRELVYYNGTPIRRDPDFHHDMDRLIHSLQDWIAPPAESSPLQTGFTLPLLHWINIPAGRVTLDGGLGSYAIAPFAIAKYPVTNAQFQAFVDDGGYQNERWWQGLTQRIAAPHTPHWADSAHPRENVTWYEAVAFTRWLSHRTGLPVTLPMEMQWQWAAVGDSAWDYPYGPEFNKTLCNTQESGIQKTTPVTFYDSKYGSKVQRQTRFGVMDQCGNVWEWCLNAYDNPDYVDITGDLRRAMRGGSWIDNQDLARVTARNGGDPDDRFDDQGFRVCCAVSIP